MSPPFSIPAPKHNAPWTKLNAIGFCSTFNVLEFPGAIVPVHWTSDGIPVGVLVTGKQELLPDPAEGLASWGRNVGMYRVCGKGG